jgi:phosphoserine phosphatase
MRGEIPLEDVYGKRLELVRPTREQVHALGERYVRTLVTDARETVAALLAEGIEVRVMSGGIRQAVVTLALALGLTERAVAAVDVDFTETGEYAGFDAASPLARSGGKRAVLERWLPELPRPIMLVGDGVTDLEARPPADTFVAFAGVVERPAVIDAADEVVRAPSLAPGLVLALGGVPPRDSVGREVFDLGRSLMRG